MPIIRGKTRAVVFFIIGVVLLITAAFIETIVIPQLKTIIESIGIGLVTVGVIAFFYDEALKEELKSDFFNTVLKERTKTDGVAEAIESIPLNIKFLRKNFELAYDIRLNQAQDLVTLALTMEYDLENRTLETIHHNLGHYLSPDPAVDPDLLPEWTSYSCRVKSSSGEGWLRNWEKGENPPSSVKTGPADWPYVGTVEITDEFDLKPYHLPGSEVHIYLRGTRTASPNQYERWSATSVTENIKVMVRYDQNLKAIVSLQHPKREWTVEHEIPEELTRHATFELDRVFLPFQGFLLKWDPIPSTEE